MVAVVSGVTPTHSTPPGNHGGLFQQGGNLGNPR